MTEQTPRVGGVIVTHGHLASELLAAAETIIGPILHISAISIGWHDDVEAARQEIARSISQVSQGRGTLLLTDMFGGTPTNIAAMLKDDHVAVAILFGRNGDGGVGSGADRGAGRGAVIDPFVRAPRLQHGV